jgi:type II secretory pathway pseudopilin PulG
MKPEKDQSNNRSGFSLIELLVATLLMIIIFIGWLSISNFQAIRKESLRRLALETASGYLDGMVTNTPVSGEYYSINPTNYLPTALGTGAGTVLPLFADSDPVGYTLQVIPNYQTNGGWSASAYWAVINLYDKHGVAPTNAFSTMSVFMK